MNTAGRPGGITRREAQAYSRVTSTSTASIRTFGTNVEKISGKVPIYFLTGEYDFACTPEMTQRTAEKVKNSECIIFGGGHFPTSEDPVKFKEVITPVLRKIIGADPERRAQGGGLTARSAGSESRSGRTERAQEGRRVIDF